MTVGVEKDIVQAANFYFTAAKKFGYFDAIVRLGNLHMQGTGVIRSPTEALSYFKIANVVGPWVGWMRRGFNQYVQGHSEGNDFDYARALMSYLHSGELGTNSSSPYVCLSLSLDLFVSCVPSILF
jgi:TPR repeat protein